MARRGRWMSACSFGYSTIWLAEAVEANGGLLTGLENVPAKAERIRQRVAQAGLERTVHVIQGDALERTDRRRQRSLSRGGYAWNRRLCPEGAVPSQRAEPAGAAGQWDRGDASPTLT